MPLLLSGINMFQCSSKSRCSGKIFFLFNRMGVVRTLAHPVSDTPRHVLRLVKAECKWCLTGTPIQNSAEDLYSLVPWHVAKIGDFDMARNLTWKRVHVVYVVWLPWNLYAGVKLI